MSHNLRRPLIKLRKRARFVLRPTAPFHFDGTVHKPSHFPASNVAYQRGTYWQTMRWQGRTLGLRLRDTGNRAAPAIETVVFATRPLSKAFLQGLALELRWRFDLDANLAEFCRRFKGDPILAPALRRWAGMRISCAYSLYEFLAVIIVLQNTTVRRTVQMFEALLRSYGVRLGFDNHELFALWPPAVLHSAAEAELRALKLGYRAKSLKRMTENFIDGAIDEFEMRTIDRETLRLKLLKIYGIGQASVWYLLFEVFHHYDTFDVLAPWEQRIYSRLLFKRKLVPAGEILAKVRRRWGRWRMLASHYIFEDLFWRHRRNPIPWLKELIRL